MFCRGKAKAGRDCMEICGGLGRLPIRPSVLCAVLAAMAVGGSATGACIGNLNGGFGTGPAAIDALELLASESTEQRDGTATAS